MADPPLFWGVVTRPFSTRLFRTRPRCRFSPKFCLGISRGRVSEVNAPSASRTNHFARPRVTPFHHHPLEPNRTVVAHTARQGKQVVAGVQTDSTRTRDSGTRKVRRRVKCNHLISLQKRASPRLLVPCWRWPASARGVTRARVFSGCALVHASARPDATSRKLADRVNPHRHPPRSRLA